MVKIPVRNKSKDNPYILGFDEGSESYTVEFMDNKRIIHKIKISNEVYKALDKFELEDVSQIHKFQRHIEHSEIYDETLNNRAVNVPTSVEEIVEKELMSETLKCAMETLSETQKRRIKMYYFDELTLQKIAQIEGCSISSVKESIESGINKLRKIIKN